MTNNRSIITRDDGDGSDRNKTEPYRFQDFLERLQSIKNILIRYREKSLINT